MVTDYSTFVHQIRIYNDLKISLTYILHLKIVFLFPQPFFSCETELKVCSTYCSDFYINILSFILIASLFNYSTSLVKYLKYLILALLKIFSLLKHPEFIYSKILA